jgi:Domain of unknown function (DUF4494)
MSMWYECKIKYRKMDDSGKDKMVTEPYLIDALSFTEAEKRTIEEMQQYISGEFKITNIKMANYSEIYPVENSDRWFKCKLSLLTLDEEKGTERRSNTYILVQANNVKEAYDNLEQYMAGTCDFEIPSVSESPIVDVFPYYNNNEEEKLNEEIPSNLTPLENFEEELNEEIPGNLTPVENFEE